MIKVLPSSNPCPEDNIVEYIKNLESMGVEYLHCDVMDGCFVDNTCLSYEVLKNARNQTNILLDVHLMVSRVYDNVRLYAKLKPNIITIHYEALKNLNEFYKVKKFLKKKQILMGLAINPNTPIEIVTRLISQVDLLLIMTVVPGKSGQKLIIDCLQKIKIAKELTVDNLIIEVDGGINLDNYKDVVNAGAEFLVMGSAFYNSDNRQQLLKQIDKHYNNTKIPRI